MMKLSYCKLNKKVQLRLLEYFTPEVTARSADKDTGDKAQQFSTLMSLIKVKVDPDNIVYTDSLNLDIQSA